MVNYYQPYLWPFLRTKQYVIPQGISRHHYHSWEDALWELLQQKKIPKGATLLVPNFHCMDVLNNIENHGYLWKMYPLDQNFQIDQSIFLDIIKEHTPAVLVIFHACGISSSLIEKPEWLKLIPPHTLIIEDCVQSVIDPQKIQLLNDNHFLIDSLRKVLPLPGSFIYGTSAGLNYTQSHRLASSYQLSSTLLFLLFRSLFVLSQLINSAQLSNFAHHTILKAHDDIIGDSLLPQAGLPFVEKIHRHLNFSKLEKKKREQVEEYNRQFEEIYTKHSKFFYKIEVKKSDFEKLHVYPVGLYGKPNNDFIKHLQKNNLSVWYKFPDCPWSQDKAVLFLPLGFHINNTDITKVRSVISVFLATSDEQALHESSSNFAQHLSQFSTAGRSALNAE
jgi:hypothetical protein